MTPKGKAASSVPTKSISSDGVVFVVPVPLTLGSHA